MKTLLFTTTLFSGLIAGLLFAYSCSVSIGLKALPAAAYVNAMQSINRAIQNPVFFVVFIGLLILFPLSTYQLYSVRSGSLWLLITAMAIYIIGVFGITMFFNVPLNEQLAKFPLLSATESETIAARNLFEQPWNMFHTIRTIAAVASFGLMIIFILKQKL